MRKNIFLNLKRFFIGLSFLTICLLILSACDSCSNSFVTYASGKDGISIVTYNTQTFFDAVDDGCEFRQFRGSKTKWSLERYQDRLAKLKEAVELASFKLGYEDNIPDILILQEIESLAVVEDFCKILPLHNSYKFAVFFSPEKNAPFSTAILSKFPIVESKEYSLYCEEVKLRPLIEARIKLQNNDEESELVIFAVHWKSKSGKVVSEPIRKMQERQVYQKLTELAESEPNTPFIICGDFNQTQEEFSDLQNIANCWDFEEFQEALSFGEQNRGSYFYKNKWEAIDHFFYSKNLRDEKDLELIHFSVINSSPLVNSKGIPYKYQIYSGRGYSDHLPIGIVLKI